MISSARPAGRVALLPWRSRHPPAATRRLHLAPPFLVEDYTPRYQLLTSAQEAQKRSAAYAHLRHCNLCPRLCGVNRYERAGVCLVGAETVPVNTIAPHFGEEPPIQGHRGSGAVFFSGCNLRCVFCQNHDIAHQRNGFDLTPEALADWYLQLQEVGHVHNINLVTPEHVVPQVVLSILAAKEKGLNLPIVYNTSAFDSLASLELLDGLVDIYLPDFKVWWDGTSRRLLKADGYAAAARESIRAMHEQVGDLAFSADGVAKRGLLVRHLVMPGLEDEGREIVRWLASDDGPGRDCFVNVMEQYCPDAHVGKPRRRRLASDSSKAPNAEDAAAEAVDVRYGDIDRPISSEEVQSVRQAAETAGLWRFADPPLHGGWSL